MRFAVLFIIFLFGYSFSFSQSAKTIRTYGIVKKTETVVKYYDGAEVSRYVEEIELYNEEGDWVEKFIYGSGGDLKLHQKRVYDGDEVIDETSIDLNGSSIKEAKAPSFERVLYAYDKGDLAKQSKLSENGDLLEQKEFMYNKLGDLVEVITTDGNGTLIERETTEYNDKGLKTKEHLADASGVTLKEKLFVYE